MEAESLFIQNINQRYLSNLHKDEGDLLMNHMEDFKVEYIMNNRNGFKVAITEEPCSVKSPEPCKEREWQTNSVDEWEF